MQRLNNPARLVPLAFLVVILFGTGLLMLPMAHRGGESAPFLTALFVATSAVGVTGLSPVDTATYWTGFGQGVIYTLFHIGGFGIMSAATLLGMVVSRRMGLGQARIVRVETRGINTGDIRAVLTLMLIVALVVEVAIAASLTVELTRQGFALDEALWHGVFMAGASFTNAGFMSIPNGSAVLSESPISLIALMVAVFVGGLGLPVLNELRRRHQSRLSLHARLTMIGTLGLFVLGTLVTLVFEWTNPQTIGPMALWEKLLHAMFHSVNARSGGLNTFATGAIDEETMLVTYALMLVGAGSASMGGGIKVTTLMIVLLAVWSELRGDTETQAFGRRLSPSVLREALVMIALSAGILMVSTMVLRLISPLDLNALIFEAISAFANVGLSMGITAQMGPAEQSIIIFLMYLGRVGIVTVATGLALRPRRTEFRYPEERPIVG